MIKTIILDVDGVIVGEKIGYNSPWPHPEVIATLSHLKKKGYFVHLCTAKPYWGIEKIVKDAHLDNLHIVDGGAVLMNPIGNVILHKHTIPQEEALRIVSMSLKNNMYVEVYTLEDYFIDKKQVSDKTEKHTHILQKEPILVDSLLETIKDKKITKILVCANDENDKKNAITLLQPFGNTVSMSWTIHPIALPLQFCVIIANGVSKRAGAEAIIEYEKSSFENTLGIGDSKMDWQFIELCRYAGAMGNASDELKQLVTSKGEGNFSVGKSVDENGVIEIFKYFNLL